MVPPDIFGRASKLAVRIKKHPNCTDAIAQDLGIIGAEVVVDPTTYQPVLTISLNAGHPHAGAVGFAPASGSAAALRRF